MVVYAAEGRYGPRDKRQAGGGGDTKQGGVLVIVTVTATVAAMETLG